MPATVRPRRSVLYMPGSNARALEKGRALPADGLILDLEDAVAPDAKRDGRAGDRQGAAGARRLCVARADRARQRARHALGPCRPHRHGARRRRRDPAAQGRGLGHGPPRAARARSRRRAGRAGDLVHDRDAARHPARRGDRRHRAGAVPGDGHLGPDQGPACAAHAEPPADAGLARDLPARRARRPDLDPGRRPSRPRRRARLRRGLPPGPRSGLRRQDADPSQADRARQRGVRPVRRPTSPGRAGSSPPTTRRAPPARASSWSTAGWSRTCTCSRRAGWWRWPR